MDKAVDKVVDNSTSIFWLHYKSYFNTLQELPFTLQELLYTLQELLYKMGGLAITGLGHALNKINKIKQS